MSGLIEFYTQDRAASMQIGKDVYRRVSIPIDDFNAACDHYGFVKERTCHTVEDSGLLHCSECGGGAEKRLWAYWHYCPNCGAKVVGE